MRLLPLIACLACVLPAVGQEVPEQSVFITAVPALGQLIIDDEQVRAGNEQVLYPDAPIVIAWDGPPQAREATLFAPGLQATVLLTAFEVEALLAEDGGLLIDILPGDTAARLDVLHQAGNPPAYVNVGEVQARVGRGALRVTRDAGGQVSFAAVAGSVEVEGPSGTKVLQAGAENQLNVAADGTVGEALAGGGDLMEVLSGQSRMIRTALLPDLVRVAESVAEGDIEPPTRGSRVPVEAVVVAVRIKEIVPRGGLVTRVDNRALSATLGLQGQSLAESFIGSREAALAVVGARLQRTRVVGVAGIGGSALSINRELTLPFTLAPLRR